MNMLARHNNNSLEFALHGGLPTFETMLRHFFDMADYEHYSDRGSDNRMTMKIGEKEVKLQLPCAGCKKENISIEVVNDFVTVRVDQEKCSDEGGKKHRYIIRERCFSSFEESIKIPVPVIGHEAKAEYTDGVLTITVPRESVKKPAVHPVKVEG